MINLNISEDITKKLDKKDYNDFEKIRYIYLYICRLFSYDIRFTVGNDELKERLYTYEPKIESIDEYELVCYSICRVLEDALKLFGFKPVLKKENNNLKYSHVYLELNYKDYVIKLDPTKRHDITRVKMNSNTIDFVSLTNEGLFDIELKDADDKIKKDTSGVDLYEFYNNETIELLVETIEKSAIKRQLTSDELFYEKLTYMFSLINTRKDFKAFDDVDYYLSYLIKKFGLNSNNNYYVKPGIFFKRDDRTLKNVVDVILIEYKNFPPEFYILEKVIDNYKVRKLNNNEINETLNEYQSYSCQFYFENAYSRIKNDRSIIL